MKWTRPLPKKLPARVHYDSGHDSTSWTGELRAIVDEEQLVIREWSPRRGWRYRIEWRWWWEEGHMQPGPLPRRRPR
jgi:hypothetical protein